MNPPEEKDDYLDDRSLRNKLKEMKDRREERQEIYNILAKHIRSGDTYTKLLELIEFGFDAISMDYDHRYGGGKSRLFREASQDANRIRRMAKRNPLLDVTVRNKMNPCWGLVKPLRKGRPPETMTKNLINDLYKLLSPIFDQEPKSSGTNFKKKSVPNSIQIIQKIFDAFYGERRDTGAIRKSIKR
jgi:hypothetical protein